MLGWILLQFWILTKGDEQPNKKQTTKTFGEAFKERELRY